MQRREHGDKGRGKRMRDNQPLAAAAERLRGKPGRPRKAKDGHVPGIAPVEDGADKGRRWSALALTAIAPRLMSLEQAALYLGVSPWTVRDLEHDGVLPRVRIPLPNRGELRKLLFDRQDLDRVIERWKKV